MGGQGAGRFWVDKEGEIAIAVVHPRAVRRADSKTNRPSVQTTGSRRRKKERKQKWRRRRKEKKGTLVGAVGERPTGAWNSPDRFYRDFTFESENDLNLR